MTLNPEKMAQQALKDEQQAAATELDRFIALAEQAGYKTIHDVPGLMDALKATEQAEQQAAFLSPDEVDALFPRSKCDAGEARYSYSHMRYLAHEVQRECAERWLAASPKQSEQPVKVRKPMSYRLLTDDDHIQTGDEVLDDDCKTWWPVSRLFVGHPFRPAFYMPHRRPVGITKEPGNA